MARLYRVILPVRDIDLAERFYSNLLSMKGERVSEGRHYFNLDGTILALYDPVAEGDEELGGWRHHPNQYLYIGVGDLEGTLKRAQSAGASVESSQIATMPWGERLFYLQDPFSNPICFVDERTLFLGQGS